MSNFVDKNLLILNATFSIGAITRGKAVCGAANNKVTQLVDQAVNEGGAATLTIFYNRKLGTALESASADGDLIFIDVAK